MDKQEIIDGLDGMKMSLLRSSIEPVQALYELKQFIKMYNIESNVNVDVQTGSVFKHTYDIQNSTADDAMVVLNLGDDVLYNHQGGNVYRSVSLGYVFEVIDKILDYNKASMQ